MAPGNQDDTTVEGEPAPADFVETPPNVATNQPGFATASGEVIQSGEDETQGATSDPSGPPGSD